MTVCTSSTSVKVTLPAPPAPALLAPNLAARSLFRSIPALSARFLSGSSKNRTKNGSARRKPPVGGDFTGLACGQVRHSRRLAPRAPTSCAGRATTAGLGQRRLTVLWGQTRRSRRQGRAACPVRSSGPGRFYTRQQGKHPAVSLPGAQVGRSSLRGWEHRQMFGAAPSVLSKTPWNRITKYVSTSEINESSS